MCLPFNKHRVNLTNINGVYKNSKVGFGALLAYKWRYSLGVFIPSPIKLYLNMSEGEKLLTMSSKMKEGG